MLGLCRPPLASTPPSVGASLLISMSTSAKHFYRFHFLKSETWLNVRLVRLIRDKTACTICGFASIHNDAHHVRYPENIWETSVNDLVTLCRPCHESVHELFGHEIPSNWRDVRKSVLKQRGRHICIVCGPCNTTLVPLKNLIGGPTMNKMKVCRFIRHSKLKPRVCDTCAPIVLNAFNCEQPSSVSSLIAFSRKALNLTV